jgi:hypothetical protein
VYSWGDSDCKEWLVSLRGEIVKALVDPALVVTLTNSGSTHRSSSTFWNTHHSNGPFGARMKRSTQALHSG